jgi:hypothetical protein
MMPRSYKLHRLIAWGIAILMPFFVYGQPTPRKITNAQWQKLVTDSTFSYRNEHEFINKPSGQAQFIITAINAIIKFFASPSGHFFIAFIAVSVLAFVAYKIFKSDHFIFNKDKKPAEVVQEEEDIAATNWEQLMQEATGQNELRLAVRYGYMWLLQVLEKKDLIRYRIDKTNYDYFTELSSTRHNQPFKDLSRQYEYTWYGHIPITAADLDNYLIKLNTLKKQL